MIPKNHKEFIRLVVSGENQMNAYKLTASNKTITNDSAKVKGSQLAKKYALEIAQEKERQARVLSDVQDKDIVQNALKQILTQAEVDAKLCDIIKGKLIFMQQLNNQGETYKSQVTPTIADITKAIDLYNKRFGSNAPVKQDITSGGEKFVQPIINVLPKS
jgi:hypothetical protein